MTVADNPNRPIIEHIFAALATGDRKPFADAMADDFSWTITGHGPWPAPGRAGRPCAAG